MERKIDSWALKSKPRIERKFVKQISDLWKLLMSQQAENSS